MDRRPVTTVIFSGFFLFGMLFILWGVLLPEMATDLAMSETVSGALFLLFSLGMMLGAIFGGKYVTKFDFLYLLAWLCAVDAILIFIMSLMTTWQGLLFMVFVVGVVSSAVITIGHTLIAQLYVEKRFAMMGIMDFMFSLGTFAASFYVTLVYWVWHEWQKPLQLLTFMLLCLSTYIFLIASRNKKLTAGQPKAPKSSLKYIEMLKQPVFMLLCLVSFGYGAVEFGNANWFVSYAKDGGYDGEQARNLLACFTAGMTLSRLVFAWFLRYFSVNRLMTVLVTLMLAGALGIKLAEGTFAIGAFNFLLGFGLGGLFPLVLSAAMNVDAGKGPVLSGISMIGNALGVQIASFTTGFWANISGLQTAFWIIPIAGIWLWTMTWFYSRQIKARA